MSAPKIPKGGRHTNDRTNVGVAVKRAKSMAAAKSGAGSPGVLHGGQPMSLAGKGLKTGHTATNC